MPVTRTSLPGAAVVPIVNRCRASRLAWAPRSWAARSTAGRHVEASTVGSANAASSTSAGWIEASSTTVTREPQHPARRREQRHVHVIEHEHLVAQHREAIEIVGALVVRDGRDRGLEPGDVRFERDGDLVAEAPLHAGADRPEEPGRRHRHAQAERRRAHQPRPAARVTPSPSSMSHSASSASGSAAACDSTSAATIRRGSWR